MALSRTELEDQANLLGIGVQRVRLPEDEFGEWDWRRRLILINRTVLDEHLAAVMDHELWHARRGDRGPQPPAVERRVNELVAQDLVDPRAYTEAERLCGWRTRCIAFELGIPRPIIQAYRRLLDRERARRFTTGV